MFRQKRKPSDFGREIEAHLQFETERLREEGLTEAEAPSRAPGFRQRDRSRGALLRIRPLAFWGTWIPAQRALQVDPAILLPRGVTPPARKSFWK